MAANLITYADKFDAVAPTGVDSEVTAANMNEIKYAINDHANRIDTLESIVPEVVRNAGPLSGTAPATAKTGVDTISGQMYYVSAGNWAAVPGASVDLNFTVSDQTGSNGTGNTSPVAPPTPTPDVGDVHKEVYDDVTIYFTATATDWTTPAVVESVNGADTNMLNADLVANGAHTHSFGDFGQTWNNLVAWNINQEISAFPGNYGSTAWSTGGLNVDITGGAFDVGLSNVAGNSGAAVVSLTSGFDLNAKIGPDEAYVAFSTATKDLRLRYVDTGGGSTNEVNISGSGIDLIFGATSDLRVGGNAGTSGQVLQSQGPSLPPVWANVSSGSNYSQTFLATDFVAQQLVIPEATHGAGTTPIVQLGEGAAAPYQLTSAQVDVAANGDVTITVDPGSEFDGRVVICNGGDSSVTGAANFLALADTPAAFAGQAGRFLAVNAGESGVEFVAVAGGNIYTADGSLTGNRSVNINGKQLWVNNGAGDTRILINAASSAFGSFAVPTTINGQTTTVRHDVGNAVVIQSNGAAPATIQIDDGAGGSASVTVPTLPANYTLTLPADTGAAGQVLSTDGAGVLSWIPAGGADFFQPTTPDATFAPDMSVGSKWDAVASVSGPTINDPVNTVEGELLHIRTYNQAGGSALNRSFNFGASYLKQDGTPVGTVTYPSGENFKYFTFLVENNVSDGNGVLILRLLNTTANI